MVRVASIQMVGITVHPLATVPIPVDITVATTILAIDATREFDHPTRPDDQAAEAIAHRSSRPPPLARAPVVFVQVVFAPADVIRPLNFVLLLRDDNNKSAMTFVHSGDTCRHAHRHLDAKVYNNFANYIYFIIN